MITTHLHNVLDALEALRDDNMAARHVNRVLYSVLPVQLANVAAVSWGIPKEEKSFGDEVPPKIKDEYKMELTLWHMLVKRLFTENEDSIASINNKERIGKFITYLKLLLTFISPHFDVAVDENGAGAYRRVSEAAVEEKDKWMNNVICDTLYKQNETNSLFKRFVGKGDFDPKDARVKSFSDYVPVTVIEKSMLYRFKQLLQKDLPDGRAYELAINMIANKAQDKKNARTATQQDVTGSDADDARKQKNAKARGALDEYFINNEKTIFGSPDYKKAWNEDFINSLIVFYSYYNLRNRLRAIFGTKKKNEK
jgi:hypothetical protein